MLWTREESVMQLKLILCALHPLIYATSVLRSMHPFYKCYIHSVLLLSLEVPPTYRSTSTTYCAISILEIRTYATPTLGVRIPHILCYLYPGDMRLYGCYPGITHPSIHIYIRHSFHFIQKRFYSYPGSEHLEIIIAVLFAYIKAPVIIISSYMNPRC